MKLTKIVVAFFLLQGLNANALEGTLPQKIDLSLQSPSISFFNQEGNIKLKERIRKAVNASFGCYIFGRHLNSLVDSVTANQGAYTNLQIPENFLLNEMDLRIEVNKKDKKFYLYQKFKDFEILLLETSVALGKSGFNTPVGNFWIKRIVNEPWYYPPQTWAKGKRPEKPGKNNSYGLWMAELCKNSELAGYEFSPKGDAGIRIHSTNKPGSIGSYSSHGCVRIHPDIAENEFFPALVHYTPHNEGHKTSRGIIYPLEKVISVEIK